LISAEQQNSHRGLNIVVINGKETTITYIRQLNFVIVLSRSTAAALRVDMKMELLLGRNNRPRGWPDSRRQG